MAVHHFSCVVIFVKVINKGVIKFQAVYRLENLVFFIQGDERLKETVLKLLVAQVD